MKAHYEKSLLVVALLFAVAGAWLFHTFYKEAEKIAISKLQEEQAVHARQAARGIEDFFATWTRNLGVLAKMDEVARNDAAGQRSLRYFYESNQDLITSIARVDENGIIIYNDPVSRTEGVDISGQHHVRELLTGRKPVISDVFRAVEGVDAVAVYAPVFRGGEFKGGVVVLVNFESLAHRYIEVIRVGETGYGWMLSRDGTILYTPVPGMSGTSVFEVIGNSPTLSRMVYDMLAGREGTASYDFDRIAEKEVASTLKYAVYLPVRIGNTFWSIAVASAEQDVLAGLISFRNKLAWTIAVIFAGAMAFAVLGAKAWFIVREEEKRVKVESQLRESERRFRQVAESSGDIIWEMDERGLYTSVSPSVEKSLGYTPEELVGKMHFYDLFVPSVREELKAVAFRIFAERRIFRAFPSSNLSKSGEIVYLETSGTPVIGSGGDLLGYCGAAADVTTRKRSEQEIARQRDELAHLSRVTTLGEISGSLAHELNQPLTAILSNAQAAQRFLARPEIDRDELGAILNDIVESDRHAGDVIHSLRLLLKQGGLRRELLDINGLVQKVLKLMRSDLLAHHISVETDLQQDLPHVLGDRVQLQQVLLNLIMNASDAMAEQDESGRRLHVATVLTADNSVCVSVRDNGRGIQAEKLGQIFESYYTTKRHGLGLGLTVCRSILLAHHGGLTAENDPAGGAVFHFSLPLEDLPGRCSSKPE